MVNVADEGLNRVISQPISTVAYLELEIYHNLSSDEEYATRVGEALRHHEHHSFSTRPDPSAECGLVTDSFLST